MYSSERPYTSASCTPRNRLTTVSTFEHGQLLQESRCELAVPMAREPALPHPPRAVAQGEVPCGPSHSDVVLLHLPTPTRNVECGMDIHPSIPHSEFRIPHLGH